MLEKHELVAKILFDTQTIDAKVQELAKVVSEYYQNNNSPVILIGILRGCVPFLASLILKMNIDLAIDFMYVESYSGKTAAISSPQIKIDILIDINKRDVLIVEDIIDSGNTLFKIRDHLKAKGANTVKIITLLDKKSKRRANIEPDWFGFEVPDYFLVGYGLDYNEELRNLPYIGIADINKITLLEKTK